MCGSVMGSSYSGSNVQPSISKDSMAGSVKMRAGRPLKAGFPAQDSERNRCSGTDVNDCAGRLQWETSRDVNWRCSALLPSARIAAAIRGHPGTPSDVSEGNAAINVGNEELFECEDRDMFKVWRRLVEIRLAICDAVTEPQAAITFACVQTNDSERTWSACRTTASTAEGFARHSIVIEVRRRSMRRRRRCRDSAAPIVMCGYAYDARWNAEQDGATPRNRLRLSRQGSTWPTNTAWGTGIGQSRKGDGRDADRDASSLLVLLLRLLTHGATLEGADDSALNDGERCRFGDGKRRSWPGETTNADMAMYSKRSTVPPARPRSRTKAGRSLIRCSLRLGRRRCAENATPAMSADVYTSRA